jgi:hypothetical protein
MIEFFLDWGYDPDPKSYIQGYFQNGCLVVEYSNTLVAFDSVWQTIEFEGHAIIVELKHGETPDIFSIKTAYGWAVTNSPNTVVVEEAQTGTLVVCPELIG